MILFTNGAIPVLVTLIDPGYIFKLISIYKLNKAANLSSMTQREANSVFELLTIDLS